MSKIKILSIAVIALIILNICTLGFFVSKAPKRPKFKQPKKVVIQKLKFDTEQVNLYNELIKSHSEKVNALDNQIINDKKELYKLLSQPNNSNKVDSITTAISLHITEIEKTHFNHFVAIKTLCKKDQLQDFNNLSKELTQIFKPKTNRPR